MSELQDVHVYEVECADKRCRKKFHILTSETKRPREGLMCVECETLYHKTGVLFADIERGNGSHINLHTGYLSHGLTGEPRLVTIEVDNDGI